MEQESIVYGCIKGSSSVTEREIIEHLMVNKKAIMSLPTAEQWPLVVREMFSVPRVNLLANSGMSNVIHFGMSYLGVEYEWNRWMKVFESLLGKMYWQSAVVHLQTELSGVHSFTWESQDAVHKPGQGGFNARCEWNHELGLVKAC